FVHGGDLWRLNTPLSCLQPPQQGKTHLYTVLYVDSKDQGGTRSDVVRVQEGEGYVQNGGEANLAERVFKEMFKKYKCPYGRYGQ
ncbi:hypothetical protein, partial [Enterobacter hormaechei]|uniref:hypothetical protein n=1 Tax=Enterobacter hormaechei TaxID=158836 RepID=UPI001E6596DC